MSIDALIKWYEDRKGKVSYSMAHRNGPNSYDCSSSLYYALWAAGFTTRISYPGNTETLFKEKGYLFEEISRAEIRRGNVFIAGREGASLGAFGHTGVVYDSNRIIHCNGSTNGIAITPIDGHTGSPVRFFRITQDTSEMPNTSGNLAQISVEQAARNIINTGAYGTGQDRINNLSALGLDPTQVQAKVNEILGAQLVVQEPVKKSIDELAREVIAGQHGHGEARRQSLRADYDKVQARVNEIMQGEARQVEEVALKYNNNILSKAELDEVLKICKHYNILPSYAIVLLHFEGLWGDSVTGRRDNNWGGMTMTSDAQSITRPSGEVVTRGTSRGSEGGYYMRYASVSSFLKDWGYLLRNVGIYRVSGAKSFEDCVRGMFRYGGASADYATMNYEGDDLETSKKRFNDYLVRMTSRLGAIEQANGSLAKYDVDFKDVKHDDIVVVQDDYEVTINGVTYVLTPK